MYVEPSKYNLARRAFPSVTISRARNESISFY